jgi:hypothetical protein
MLPAALMAAHAHRMHSSSLSKPSARIQTATVMFIPDGRVNRVVHGCGQLASPGGLQGLKQDAAAAVARASEAVNGVRQGGWAWLEVAAAAINQSINQCYTCSYEAAAAAAAARAA